MGFISKFVPEKTFPILGIVLTAIGTVIVIVSLSPLVWLTILGVVLVFIGIRCVK